MVRADGRATRCRKLVDNTVVTTLELVAGSSDQMIQKIVRSRMGRDSTKS